MYSKNDYRYYLEHRLSESDNHLAHYGVKGMKWSNKRLAAQNWDPNYVNKKDVQPTTTIIDAPLGTGSYGLKQKSNKVKKKKIKAKKKRVNWVSGGSYV